MPQARWPGSGRGGPARRRVCGPVWPAAGEGPAAVVTHSSTGPWYLQITRRLSWVFARILRSLMHTLLSWQLKKPQTGTSEHELKERACHIALSALPRGWAGDDPHELRLLARRSRPGVRSTRPGPYVGPTLRRNPDMFSMAVAAIMRRHRIAAAAALAAALIAPGAGAAARA